MLTSIKQRMDREDEGFTLIELMVVLLIIAILLAIAIPTFLGARSTANARSTQENLRNALTAEKSNYTSTQSFANGLSADEPSLTWASSALNTASTDKGAAKVETALYTETVNTAASPVSMTTAAGSSSTADGVMIVGWAKDNNCYYIYQSENASLDFTAYAVSPATSSGCDVITAPTVAPSPGTSAASSSAGTWSASF